MKPIKVPGGNMEGLFCIIFEWGRNSKLRSHERLNSSAQKKICMAKKSKIREQTEKIFATHHVELVFLKEKALTI